MTQAAPRVPPVTDPDPDLRARLAKAPTDADGRPLNLFGTLAHRPRLLSLVNALGGRLMFDSVLPDRRRELVVLRTAGLTGCAYELAAHRALGRTAGLDAGEVEAAVDPTLPWAWGAADAALLRVVDEVCAGADVGDAAWLELELVLDEAGCVELLVLVGFYRLLAGVLNGARVAVDGDAPVIHGYDG